MRYVLAGFCEYGPVDLSNVAISSEAAHNQFMSMYDPVYDGTAALAGFRSGDLIEALEVCEESTRESAVAVDATTATTAVGSSSNVGSIRRKVDITGITSDEEWVHFAQSCEQLQPGTDTVMWVRRKDRQPA